MQKEKMNIQAPTGEYYEPGMQVKKASGKGGKATSESIVGKILKG